MMRHGLAPLLLTICTLPAPAAAPVAVRELRIQKVGDVSYFHVRLAPPSRMPPADSPRNQEQASSAEPTPAEARLVSPDAKARHIYQRLATPSERGPAPASSSRMTPADSQRNEEEQKNPREPVPVEGLEFVGKVQALDEIKLALLYSEGSPPDRVSWKETSVTLDLRKAKEVALSTAAKTRRTGPAPKDGPQNPVRDDLEGLWADAQVAYFSRAAGQIEGFGFPAFGARATVRKYNVPSPPSGVMVHTRTKMVPYTVTKTVPTTVQGRTVYKEVTETHQRPVQTHSYEGNDGWGLYEMTTGAAAIAESLALRRMAGVVTKDDGKRTVEVAKIQGIDVAEHPWEKMMAGKKPADEPLARFIPHDNYYLTFKNPRKLTDLRELLGQWGNSLGRAFKLKSRDYRIRERYAEQLCLHDTLLARRVGPRLLQSVTITGNDPYLREGSDLTILFHVNNKKLFLAGLDRLVQEARRKHGDALKESHSTYQDIAIASFVTPLREVSLHRALLGDYVLYSNSPVGLRRVLDAHQGKGKRLADARDFQYMRTIFRNDDEEEDGFLFLSDAFIRQLVGPASKIKEKRRLEALTSLYMLTHGALFHAWETGQLPDSYRKVLAGANLKTEEVPMPEGKAATWDATRQVAFSETYNTLHFATPLVELPMDRASQGEVEQYNRFRLEYLGLWRQYFDPIGVRFGITDSQVKIDTYILPLIQNSGYNTLRRVAGGGTFALDTGSISPNTLFQFIMHLSPNVQDRRSLFGLEGEAAELDLASVLIGALGPVGSWTIVRIDDSPVFSQVIDLAERARAGKDIDSDEMMRLVFQMPVVFGVDIKNPLTFGAALATMRTAVVMSLPGGITWEPLEKPYKGVPIVRVQASAAATDQLLGTDGRTPRKRFQPSVYYALIDGGFYLTLSDKMLHSLIDQMEARKKGDARIVPVNSSLYLAPGAAKEAGKLLRLGLEMRTHELALGNLPLWHTLYRCGLIGEKTEAGKARETAYRYLGFVPLSPDGSAYRYEVARDEVENERHGSLRKPISPKTSADEAPLTRLLEQLRSIRADLRFREDGIHTVLTIERHKAK
ncbi:MAG: hypothetical protein HYS12_10755 [Planctomycetes bacterium]|nr:hypothetical protein [Planctomycetota bacterium]